jgi:hypothetical protein
MDSKYNIFNICKEFKENRHLIVAHFKGQTVEGMSNDDTTILGMGVMAFVIFAIIALVIWFWAIYELYKNWAMLPDWAKVVGLVALLGPLGGPVVTLIVVYIAKPKY